jgi:ABC-2 type transport system ATP-binding protein
VNPSGERPTADPNRILRVTDAALEVVDLVKRYGATTAVDGLSFTVRRGSVLALLGPNGAGKTTTVEVAEGFRQADGGAVRVLGLDPRDKALKPRIGVMPQAGGGYPSMPAGEMLRLTARYHRDPLDPTDLLERLALTGVVRTPWRRLSGGQQQRLSLAMAVIGRPELLFLDEPTAGLDPQARRATWDLIRSLRRDGGTVLLTTHLMDEAENLADEVVVVDHGRLIAAGTVRELTRAGATEQLHLVALAGLDTGALTAALPDGSVARETSPGRYVVDGKVDPDLLTRVTSWFAEQGVLLEDLKVERRTLEDVFLDLTGRDLRT